MIPSSLKQTNNPKNTVIFKIVFYTELIELLKLKLYKTSWDDKVMIKLFLNRFSGLHNTYFPKKQIKLKSNDLLSPWITNGIKKSSKQKQRLYDKFLKNWNEKNELEYKT